MSTEPKESEDVFVFIAANPDKLAKAQKHVSPVVFLSFRPEITAPRKSSVDKAA